MTRQELFKHMPENTLVAFYKDHQDHLGIIEEDFSPIHMAFTKQKMNFVDFLMDNKADFNLKNTYGLTPFACAAINPLFNPILPKLVSLGAKADDYDCFNNAFSNALMAENIDAVKYFLSLDLDFKGVFRDKKTLGHFATIIKDKDILLTLKDKGVDFNSLDSDGNLPSQYAEMNENEIFLEMWPAIKEEKKAKPAKKKVKK